MKYSFSRVWQDKKFLLTHSLPNWKFTIILCYWYISCFQGGIQFVVVLKEALLESDTKGVAYFERVGDASLEKTSPHTFSGFIPGKLIVWKFYPF